MSRESVLVTGAGGFIGGHLVRRLRADGHPVVGIEAFRGMFSEAVAFGKPVVATRGTWLARQIEVGRAAGTVCDDLRPDSIAAAIARCVADLEPLTQSARALSPAWRRTDSLPAFVDLMETTITTRSQANQPAGKPSRSRWSWPRVRRP